MCNRALDSNGLCSKSDFAGAIGPGTTCSNCCNHASPSNKSSTNPHPPRKNKEKNKEIDKQRRRRRRKERKEKAPEFWILDFALFLTEEIRILNWATYNRTNWLGPVGLSFLETNNRRHKIQDQFKTSCNWLIQNIPKSYNSYLVWTKVTRIWI